MWIILCFPFQTLEFDDGDRDIEVTPILKNIDRRRDSEKSVSFSINGDEVIPRLADFDEEEELEKRSDCAETPTESKELEEYSGDTDTAAANGNAHDAEELTVDTSDGIATNGNFEESPLEEDSQSGEDLEEVGLAKMVMMTAFNASKYNKVATMTTVRFAYSVMEISVNSQYFMVIYPQRTQKRELI